MRELVSLLLVAEGLANGIRMRMVEEGLLLAHFPGRS